MSQEVGLKAAPGHIHALGRLRAPQGDQEGAEPEDVLVGAEKNDSWCFVPECTERTVAFKSGRFYQWDYPPTSSVEELEHGI